VALGTGLRRAAGARAAARAPPGDGRPGALARLDVGRGGDERPDLRAPGGRESHTWDLRKSVILPGLEVCWAPDRAPLLPLRFSIIFYYGG
jgi:hypothetical protein